MPVWRMSLILNHFTLSPSWNIIPFRKLRYWLYLIYHLQFPIDYHLRIARTAPTERWKHTKLGEIVVVFREKHSASS